MKNSAILATALTFTSAFAAESASPDFGKVITDRLMDYAGLSSENSSVDLAGN